jgi:hypothetical protein
MELMSEESKKHILLNKAEFEARLETLGYHSRNANGGLFGKLVRNNLDDSRKWTADNIAYQGIVGKGIEGSLISVSNLTKNLDRLPEIKELGEVTLRMCVELVESFPSIDA